jgi:uncharacterized protein (DUF433 family)
VQLNDYFTILAPNDIRVKGTRVGIETILTDYLELGLFAEQIAARYPTLTLEQVYATLTYYWHDQLEVDKYLQSVEKEVEKQRLIQTQSPSPAIKRLREAAYQQQSG